MKLPLDVLCAVGVAVINGSIAVVKLAEGEIPYGYFNATVIAGFWAWTMLDSYKFGPGVMSE